MADTKITALTAVTGAARSMLIPVVEDPSGTPVTKKMTVDQLLRLDSGTHASSSPLIDMAQTWNAGGTTFTALKFNIAATAAAADSLLLDIQVGGTSKFKVRHDGLSTAANLDLTGDTLSAVGSMYLKPYGSTVVFIDPTLGLKSLRDFTVEDGYFIGWNNGGSGLSNARLYFGGTGIIDQRNGTAAQTLRIYNTYTDGSNYERGVFDWGTTSNILSIGTQAAGTGTVRDIRFIVGGGLVMIAQATGNLFINNSMQVSGAINLGTGNEVNITHTADGVLRLRDAAGTSFNRIQFGGTTSSFPAIKRDGAALKVRLADDSADSSLTVSTIALSSNGSQSAPSLILSGRGADYGLYSPSSSSIGFTFAGVGASVFYSDGSIYTFNDNSTLTFGASNDLHIRRDAANVLAQRNGTTAQESRLYHTYTDGSNYERITFKKDGSGSVIAREVAGTGGAGALRIFANTAILSVGPSGGFTLGNDSANWWHINSSGNLTCVSDATYTIGLDGANRPIDIHLSRNLVIGMPQSLGGGSKVINIGNATTVPTTDPTGGGILYCEAGALKFRGTSGTVTTIAPA